MKPDLKQMATTLAGAALLFAATSVVTVPGVWAQVEDRDEVDIRGERITIEVDTEGRVLVNGQHVSEADGPVVLRVEPRDGQVEVEAIGPRHRNVVVRRTPRPGRDVLMHRRDDDAPRIEEFDFEFDMPPIPDIAPMIERFSVEIGDPLRESWEEHREVAELERESREIARNARAAEGGERRELENELRAQLREIFDRKLELRQERIEDLEEKLANEKENLERRRNARDEMIDRRSRELMGEDDVLDW